MLRTVIVVSLFLVAFGLSGLAIYESSAYQNCSAEAGGKGSPAQQEKGPPHTFMPLINGGLIKFRCIGRSIDENNAVVTAVATVVIAVFLGLFTMSLARSTRIAADAARRSADSDGPHMLPIQFKISGMRGPVGDDGKIKILVEYRFINYGRSPAFMKEFHVLVHIGSQLPKIPDYGKPDKSSHIIAVAGWFGTSNPVEHLIPASDAADILDGRTNYFVFGYVEYNDVASQNHKIRFAYGFDWGPGDASERFRPDGPDTYREYT
jgi:hypothetical protein